MKRITKKSLITVFAFIFALAAITPAVAETIFTDNNGFSYTQLDGNFASVCDWDGGSDTLNVPLMVNDSYVKEIGAWSFSNRDDFTAVSFDKADYLSSIGMMAFKESSISGSVNLPAQIKSIGTSAFQGCSSLETVYYNSTADIPEQCFYSCSNLETAILADGVKSIGKFAFSKCNSLDYIRIPASVTSIDSTAFKDSPNVTIHCYNNSYAHSYALDNGINYTLIDAPDPELLLGDANGDGSVNINDVTAIQKYKLGMTQLTEYGMLCADVNHDGDVTIRDATLIQMKIAGISVGF